MAADHETVRVVLGGLARVTAWGEVAWSMKNGSWRGRVDGCDSVLVDVSLMVEFQVRPRRPSEPSVLLLDGSTCLLRLDHNQVHKGRLGTHIQSGLDPTLLEWPQPDQAGSPPAQGVTAQHVKVACLKGASLLGVNVDGVIWIDPPEGQ